MATYPLSLFIFRRDLRLPDNTGLIEALHTSEKVLPCFIFDKRQVGKENEYRSMNALQFMLESLEDLDTQLHEKDGRLYFFYGTPDEIIKKLIEEKKINAIFCNRDYTPFAIERDKTIEKVCADYDIPFHQYGDALLHEPEEIKNQSNAPFSVFTPFYKASLLKPIRKKASFPSSARFYRGHSNINESKDLLFKKIVPEKNDNLHVNGGRSVALGIIRSLSQFKDYQKTRDFPSLTTTNLSAHLKFGTLSVREAYEAMSHYLGQESALSRQLYWRDFFTHVAFHSPYVFGQAFHHKYNNLPWKNDTREFKTWCSGTTGFPIVDAGMRQLNTTGYMHNRLRMIVASFLTKDLHIDWQWGERYFAQHLVDYDPCVNNGSWQWAASTGCDSQPYFRIFNPWLQQQKFDPECIYIKKWVPELKKIPIASLHKWYTEHTKFNGVYPAPMVDHAQESERTKIVFRNCIE